MSKCHGRSHPPFQPSSTGFLQPRISASLGLAIAGSASVAFRQLASLCRGDTGGGVGRILWTFRRNTAAILRLRVLSSKNSFTCNNDRPRLRPPGEAVE
jgi:hypothetical protein